ncbi:putative transcription factor WD40-like family [Medicago truncatula]|uniref:Putative transcription factor WD40-like family n=1 Tax=Medicago truncatula TaxID=3880 RepID=A0A072TV41_MEDTR|nr:protein JINGUBANG [Medicago truncatula]KEH20738.1 transducin/WD40 repeat protein [Medicago truncatula]RHN42837.1 putative transcription factor WD40-like family [Medicago truncatula]
MRLRWLLDTCSSANNCATATHNSTISLHPSKKQQHASDSSTSSSSTLTSDDSTSTLYSNYSIQTLPSVPSLQKLSSQNLNNFSVSYHCITSLTPHSSRPITSLALHNNLLYAATENQINVYDRQTCTYLHTFNTKSISSGSTKTIAFSKDMVFTTHQDCKIRVWNHHHHKNNNNHRKLTTLPTVNDRFRRFLLPSNYINIRRHVKRLWIEHADAVTDLAVSNGVIYSVSWDKTLKIWRISDLRCLESLKAHEDAVNAVAVSNDGTVYTGSSDKRIRVWAKPVGEKKHVLVATLEKHKSAVNALALNDDGSVLFSGACDRSILVWEREDSANHMVVSGALRGHQKAILCLINVSDLLLSGSADRTVRIWKRVYDGSFCCVGVLDGHRKPVKSLAAIQEYNDDDESQSSPNGVVSVFSGSLDGEIKVWQLSIGCDLASQGQSIFSEFLE